MSRAARMALVAITVLMSLAATVMLAACGGGDPEPEPQRGTNPPDCQAHPEQCR